MSRVAIVAALEKEVLPLVKQWRIRDREYSGRRFRFFEQNDAVLICGGMGAEAARRAAEAAIALYKPAVVYSAGFAGALVSELKVAAIVRPRRVVNAGDGSSVTLDDGEGVLVSFGAVASPEQKAQLRDSFAAQAVDMEAAVVARAAEARGVKFGVVKVISDDFDFVFPSMERFIDSEGRFREMGFAAFAAIRPWLWPRVFQLARNSNHASRALCDWLGKMIANPASHSASACLETVDRR
jgi:adenosylhomocysteine nucleosidase